MQAVRTQNEGSRQTHDPKLHIDRRTTTSGLLPQFVSVAVRTFLLLFSDITLYAVF